GLNFIARGQFMGRHGHISRHRVDLYGDSD
ncbi:unnamed protein product, partial [marine sediment metagenome]